MPMLMAHPKTVSFYGDMIGASVICLVVLVLVGMALNGSHDPQKLISASLPLSIVFAALVHSLGQRIIAHSKSK